MQFSLMTQSAFTTSWTTWICNKVDSNQDVVRFYIVVLKRTRVWFYLLYFDILVVSFIGIIILKKILNDGVKLSIEECQNRLLFLFV